VSEKLGENARSPADLRGVSVTGHAGWCHTELGVMGGYWRVTAIGCDGLGIARMVIGPAAAGPG